MAIIATLFFTQTSCATSALIGMPCADLNIQSHRSSELQKIREADQADRTWYANGISPDLKTLEKMSSNDLSRRMWTEIMLAFVLLNFSSSKLFRTPAKTWRPCLSKSVATACLIPVEAPRDKYR